MARDARSVACADAPGRSCLQCRYCVMQDFGYSNYTVEGTSVECLLDKHPEAPFDRWYGEDERLAFAQQCKTFKPGDPVEIDCDREAAIEAYVADGDAETLTLLRAWDPDWAARTATPEDTQHIEDVPPQQEQSND